MIYWEDDDGVIHVRNSERGTLDRCPQQWWWGWREGLKAKETAKPLWFGTAIHEALAEWYQPGLKRSKDYIDKFRESADMEAEYFKVHNLVIDEDEWVEAKLLGEAMLRGYVEHYGKDKHWDVVATEQEFEVSIPAEFLDAGHFILNGTFDGVYFDKRDKKFKLMEHKTAASISIGHLPMDNQAGTYWMVAYTVLVSMGVLKKNQHISEITYNFLRKALPDERPKDAEGYATNKPIKKHYIAALEKAMRGRGRLDKLKLEDLAEMCADEGLLVLGDRSMTQPPPLFERHPVRKTKAQRKMQLMRLQQEVKRMDLYVKGVLDVTKAPSRDHCGWCPFREMCELHESGAGWTEFRDALYRTNDPYADHRKSA